MDSDEIGAKIRKRRQQLRMSQQELANAIPVNVSSVINWEQGKHFPRRYLGAIEQVLGISLEDEAEEPLEIPPDLQEYIDNLSDRQRELFIEALRAGQQYRRSRSQGRRRSAG